MMKNIPILEVIPAQMKSSITELVTRAMNEGFGKDQGGFIIRQLIPESYKPRKSFDNIEDTLKKYIRNTRPIKQSFFQTSTGIFEATAERTGVKNKKRKLGGKKSRDEVESENFVRVREFIQEAVKSEYNSDKDLNDIEKQYWDHLTKGKESYYFADINAKLTDNDFASIDIERLGSKLDSLLGKQKIPGITNPYTYIGSMNSTFSWHVEDVNMFSINFVHTGAAKCWYMIPAHHGKKMEKFVEEKYLSNIIHKGNCRCEKIDGICECPCSQPLKHKHLMIDPNVLTEYGIDVFRGLQQPGDIVITMPYGYHAGFNLGFNIAQAANFVTEFWYDYAIEASNNYCLCSNRNVVFNSKIMGEIKDIVDAKKPIREMSRNIDNHIQKRKPAEYRWFRRCKSCERGIFDYKTIFEIHENACNSNRTKGNETSEAINCPRCFKWLGNLSETNKTRHINHCKIDFSNFKENTNKGKIYNQNKKKQRLLIAKRRNDTCEKMRAAKKQKISD